MEDRKGVELVEMERSALLEKLVVFGTLAIAVVFIGSGATLAIYSGDPHWLNRSGAAVVAVEALIAAVEFVRRSRLVRLDSALSSVVNGGSRATKARRRRRVVENELHRSERRTLSIALLLAVAGELLHGFGDLLIHPFM